MSAITQNANTKIFVEQVNKLINESKVKNYKEIADAIEWDKTSISNVISGRRNIPHEKFSRFAQIYNLEKSADAGYKEKYYKLLEQRISERDNIEMTLKNLLTKVESLEKSHYRLIQELSK